MVRPDAVFTDSTDGLLRMEREFVELLDRVDRVAQSRIALWEPEARPPGWGCYRRPLRRMVKRRRFAEADLRRLFESGRTHPSMRGRSPRKARVR